MVGMGFICEVDYNEIGARGDVFPSISSGDDGDSRAVLTPQATMLFDKSLGTDHPIPNAYCEPNGVCRG